MKDQGTAPERDDRLKGLRDVIREAAEMGRSNGQRKKLPSLDDYDTWWPDLRDKR